MSDHAKRRRTTPPQNAPVPRKGLNTARSADARDQPLAQFLAPSLAFTGKPGNPFAGEDAE